MTTLESRLHAIVDALSKQVEIATEKSALYPHSCQEHLAELRAYRYAFTLVDGTLAAHRQDEPDEYQRAIQRGEDLPTDDESEAVMWRFAITESGRAALNDHDDEGDQGWGYPEFGDDDDLDDLLDGWDDDDEADTKELVTITDAQIANWGDQ